MQLLLKINAYLSRFYCNKTYPSYEFLVVFGQVRVWDRKSAGRVRVGMVCGGVWVQGGWGQNISNSCGARQVRTQNFNPRRTLLIIEMFM